MQPPALEFLFTLTAVVTDPPVGLWDPEQQVALQPGDEIERPLHVENGGTVEPVSRSLAAVEKEHITRVLDDLDGNVSQAARVLGIDRATLYNKIKRYGVRRDK